MTLILFILYTGTTYSKKLVWQGRGHSISYDRAKRVYLLKTPSGESSFSQKNYQNMMTKISSSLKNPSYVAQINTTLKSFHKKMPSPNSNSPTHRTVQRPSKKLVWQGKGSSISYDYKRKVYFLKTPAGNKRFSQHEAKHIITNLQKEMNNPAYVAQIAKQLQSFHHKVAIFTPSSETALVSGLNMLHDIEHTMNNPQGSGCGEVEYFPNQGPALEVRVSPKASADIDDYTFDFKMHQEGFSPMGKLIGYELNLMGGNDNILHGGYKLVKREGKSKFEGDDRGATFDIAESAQFNFEKGSVKLGHYSKGYSRLAPQSRTYSLNGQQYTSTFHQDVDGKTYQEFLNIEGVEIEVRHKLGSKDTYVRVTGVAEKLSDRSGTAIEMQESWHALHEDKGTIQYHNVDHMEDRSRVGAGLNLGKDWTIHKSNRAVVKAKTEVGAFASSDGSRESNLNVRGELSLGLGDSDDPSLVLTLAGEKKFFGNGDEGQSVGVEIQKTWEVGKGGTVGLRGALRYHDGPLEDEWSQAELEENGRFDFDHEIGIFYQKNFDF